MDSVSWCIASGIAAALFFAVRSLVRTRRHGGCAGCCFGSCDAKAGCSDCSHCSKCPSKDGLQ